MKGQCFKEKYSFTYITRGMEIQIIRFCTMLWRTSMNITQLVLENDAIVFFVIFIRWWLRLCFLYDVGIGLFVANLFFFCGKQKWKLTNIKLFVLYYFFFHTVCKLWYVIVVKTKNEKNQGRKICILYYYYCKMEKRNLLIHLFWAFILHLSEKEIKIKHLYINLYIYVYTILLSLSK